MKRYGVHFVRACNLYYVYQYGTIHGMKDIKCYEGIYAIARDGRVWSYPREVRQKHRTIQLKGKWLDPEPYSNGYFYVSLFKNGKGKQYLVHRIVAETYLINTLHVNHKNGIKTDNQLENLEWVTPSQNAYHARQILLVGIARGERAGMAKLTEKEVIEMRRLWDTKSKNQNDIAKIFHVDRSHVSRIVNRQKWTHVQ